MNKNNSISFVVTAYNEELNLENTIKSIHESVLNFNLEIEIIIVNDCSLDNTAKIADSIVLNNSNLEIKVLHLDKNLGLGGAYFSGVAECTKDYIMWIPGDNECGFDNIVPLLNSLGKADILVPFVVNTEIRKFSRRLISSLFVWLVNLLSGLNLFYYNGTVIHKKNILQSCPIKTTGFGYQAKILIFMLHNGATYLNVPVQLGENIERPSNAFKFKNILNITITLFQIILFRIFRNPKYL
jgi:glycosyltransferase involved in cell wall biosynthesis